MNRRKDENWELLSMGLSDEAESERLRAAAAADHESRAQQDEARRTHIALVRTYEAFDRNHDELREQLTDALPDGPPPSSSKSQLRLVWQRVGGETIVNNPTIRKLTVILAPAACLLIAAVIFFGNTGKPAFARAIERLRQAHTIVCRVSTTVKIEMEAAPQDGPFGIDPSKLDGFQSPGLVRTEKLYLSGEHGVRRDAYENEQIVATVYTATDGTTLMLNTKNRTYQKFELDDQLKELADDVQGTDVQFMSLAQSPDRLLRGLGDLTAGADRELGRDTIDGREVVGYEIAGAKVGLGPPLTNDAPENRAELWVDAQTNSPARLLFHLVTSFAGTSDLPINATTTMTIVYDRFEWDPPLDAGWFEAVIPDGYTRQLEGLPEKMQMPDEAALIVALRAFSELAGRYPASLNAMSASQEVAFAIGSISAKRIAAERAGRPAPDLPDISALAESLPGLALYTLLEMKGRAPHYHGESVQPGDADTVLMTWNLDDDHQRVIYGDLRAETLPADK